MGWEKVEEEENVTIDESGRKHKLKQKSKQKGKSYSKPKVCSESNGMTSRHIGVKKSEKGKNDTSAQKRSKIEPKE